MNDNDRCRNYQFRITYVITLLFLIIITNYALFSPSWRKITFPNNDDLINFNDIDDVTLKEHLIDDNIQLHSNKPNFTIPQQMGILRDLCHHNVTKSNDNDDVTLMTNLSTKMELNRNDSIFSNINKFKQQNNVAQFCFIWSTKKPLSDTIIMCLVIITMLLDAVAAIAALIDYDGQEMWATTSQLFVSINLILALLFTIAIVTFACSNGRVTDTIKHVIRRLENTRKIPRYTGQVQVTFGSGFYNGFMAMVIYWMVNIGTIIYWKWIDICRLIANLLS